jgi:hypothetical protein
MSGSTKLVLWLFLQICVNCAAEILKVQQFCGENFRRLV